ncbi:hypothetical protein IJD44_08660 [bacterium]|nr:hypothetical protein [bacterium]
MKISNIQKINTYNLNNVVEQKKGKGNTSSQSGASVMVAYPQNYYVSFGAKDFNSVYNQHKDSEMPSTVRNYIENQQCLLSDSDFETFSKLGLKIIQRSAFADLKDCKTVADIKAMYPNEDVFKGLKTLSEISTNSRFFEPMCQLERKGIKTLNCDEDVTTFLVKKIYLEGKSYKDVLEDLAAVITPESQELKEKLDTYTEARRTFFVPLGIKAPNGQTYGRDLQNSDPAFLANRKKYFSNLSPEEVNERIQKLLESTEKSRVAMIDAWNHCPQIREDLSNFLTENINNPTYAVKDEGFDVYDVQFYSKMRRLMLGFWNKYPSHKEELGKEIKIALENFDRMKALGEDKFNEYVLSVQNKSKEIRNNIQLNKASINEKYPHAIELLEKIADKANPMLIKTKSANKDFFNLLLNSVSTKELGILQGNDSSAEYKALFPDGIKNKMRQLITTTEYANYSNSQNFAFLQELLLEGIIGEDDIDLILNSNEPFTTSIRTLFSQNSKDIDLSNIDRRYNNYKLPMSSEEKDAVIQVLVDSNPDFNLKDIDKLDSLLSTQGKYMKLAKGNNMLKNLTQQAFWTEYDNLYGTNYSTTLIENINFDKLLSSAIDIVDKMDFSELD